jgi:hypothetical protein
MQPLKLSKVIELCDGLDDATIYIDKHPMQNNDTYVQTMWMPRGWKFWNKRAKDWQITIQLMEFTADGKEYTRRWELNIKLYDKFIDAAGAPKTYTFVSYNDMEKLIKEAKTTIIRESVEL